MQGSIGILGKNLRNFLPGLVALGSQSGKAYMTWKRFKDRQYALAPESVRDMLEVYEPTYQKRGISQEKNMWLDKELSKEVSREDLAHLLRFQCDAYRVAHAAGAAFATGGYAVPFYTILLGNDTFMPSTFNATPEETANWRQAQDLYRYKFSPLYLCDIRWYLDYHSCPPADKERAWDDMWEKNDIRRDPKSVRVAAELYDAFLPMSSMRRRAARHLARSMVLPTFPLWAKLCVVNRIRAYWELIWHEDYMVMTEKAHLTMSDEDLQDFAWRRFLAPYDKNLTRAQVTQRVDDYFEVLGETFLKDGTAPNIHILSAYCLGYYNDPAYLVDDIAELEKNDYDNIASWGKDAFLRRLEFENGPLRDQVEAHTHRLIEKPAA